MSDQESIVLQFARQTQAATTSWANVPLICAAYMIPHNNIIFLQNELSGEVVTWPILVVILQNHIFANNINVNNLHPRQPNQHGSQWYFNATVQQDLFDFNCVINQQNCNFGEYVAQLWEDIKARNRIILVANREERNRVRHRITNMTPAQIEAQRAADRIINMTPAQIEAQRAADRIINMTPGQAEAQRAADRNRRQHVIFVCFSVFTFMSLFCMLFNSLLFE